MKKLFFYVCVGWVSLGLISCEKTQQQPKIETDQYGVELGTIPNYQGTNCTVTVKKQEHTRTSSIDEVYEFSVDKPGREVFSFIITMEEIPGENRLVITQYDEFWNEVVALVYTGNRLTDVIVADSTEDSEVMTRGWLGNLWNCSKVRYREIKKFIEDDDDWNFYCGIVDYVGICGISSVAVAVVNCA